MAKVKTHISLFKHTASVHLLRASCIVQFQNDVQATCNTL